MKQVLIEGGQILEAGHFQPKDLLVETGKIVGIGKNLAVPETTRRLNASGLFILPGFIDIHTHGALDVDFNHATEADLVNVSTFFATTGVTGYLPTVITDQPAVMLKQLDLLSQEAVLAANPTIAAIHLEGPFLSPRYKGAMAESLLRKGDIGLFRELYAASRGQIKIITLAPEVAGMLPLIEEAVSLGVRVSIGHSEASYEEAMRAINAGATSTTHIMNAMKLLHMHDPAVLTAVLESDVYAEIIADGFHLHPPIVRLLLKTKGWQRIIAVTDAISATGYPDGEYQLGPNRIVVQDGDAQLLSSGVRAGSTLTMERAFQNLIAFTGQGVEKISPLLSSNAAKLLGFTDRGSIAIGKRADLVGVDTNNTVQLTIVAGKILYKGNSSLC